ncbi:hypothetical protein [Natrinema ejinorense]|uniref:C2H2-type domain-containing protein n=1 Tax=Natrinema ejinorense TaxID=373386 RepID=A0A2A5QRH5_9EURY|nr:hypothetical protein [Natrinema ejinorense]PCR89451.1 hypothetical protein CP557_02195 [Natrinema ejinorense]
MSLLEKFHEEYECDGDLVLFRCTECSRTSLSLGSIHAHCEKHRGYTQFNHQLPFTKTSMVDFDALIEYTEVLCVKQTHEISLNEVEGM